MAGREGETSNSHSIARPKFLVRTSLYSVPAPMGLTAIVRRPVRWWMGQPWKERAKRGWMRQLRWPSLTRFHFSTRWGMPWSPDRQAIICGICGCCWHIEKLSPRGTEEFWLRVETIGARAPQKTETVRENSL